MMDYKASGMPGKCYGVDQDFPGWQAPARRSYQIKIKGGGAGRLHRRGWMSFSPRMLPPGKENSEMAEGIDFVAIFSQSSFSRMRSL